MKYIFLLLVTAWLSNCNTSAKVPLNESANDSALARQKSDTTAKHKQGDDVTYAVVLSGSENYSLKVVTTYRYDTAAVARKYTEPCDSIIEKQKIYFLFNGAVVKEIDFFENGKCLFVTKHTNPANTFDIISSIYLVQGQNTGAIYHVIGYGCSNGGSSLYAYFSMEGELLYSSYYDYPQSDPVKIGNYASMLAQYNLSDTMHVNGLWVFPPDLANQKLREAIGAY